MEIEAAIENEYKRLMAFCQSKELPEYMLNISQEWSQGIWKMYWALLEKVKTGFEGKSVVDFGCKYGHLLPMLVAQGAKEAIGIDAEDSYVEAGQAVFEILYPNVRILKSEFGYIPLQPETIDIIVANEVISHINPGYLETVYVEFARILKPGGILLISDGNNLENKQCLGTLLPFYEAWENGPDGMKTDRDTVVESYLTRRKKIIKAHHPDLEPACVEELALNTSGLFGDFLLRVIDEYVRSGELIRRPYRRGVCPTNPGSTGVVIERGFFPLQVEMSLASYGIDCYLASRQQPEKAEGCVERLKDIYSYARSRLSDRPCKRAPKVGQPEARVNEP